MARLHGVFAYCVRNLLLSEEEAANRATAQVNNEPATTQNNASRRQIGEYEDPLPSYEIAVRDQIQLEGNQVCDTMVASAWLGNEVNNGQAKRRNNASTRQISEEEPPPSYEIAAQNQIQLEGSPLGSCLNTSLVNETADGNEPNSVYFIDIPLEDSTVPNSTSSRVQSVRNDLNVPIT